MNKIEQIEQLVKKWRADSKRAYEDGDLEYEKLSMNRAIALESALAILVKPSNTRMHMDSNKVHVTYRCRKCYRYYGDYTLAERCCQ